MLLKPPLAKSAERTITALAFNSTSALQIVRFNLPSTGYETRLDRIISARCLRCLRYNFRLSATTAPAKNLLAIVSSCLTVPDSSGLAMSRVVHVPGKD